MKKRTLWLALGLIILVAIGMTVILQVMTLSLIGFIVLWVGAMFILRLIVTPVVISYVRSKEIAEEQINDENTTPDELTNKDIEEERRIR